MAQGLPNGQMAVQLASTERGAAVHVERILDKLGVNTRTQIGAWAAQCGLLATIRAP